MAKKEKEELVIHQPSVPFYKAFMFPTPDVDQTVDTSGDVFSYTPEDAIMYMLDNMNADQINSIPGRVMRFFMSDDEITTKESNPNMHEIIVMRITVNWNEEFVPAVSNDDGKNFSIALRDIKNGYTTGLQDYNIANIEIRTRRDDPTPVMFVEKLIAEIFDTERANPLFPEKIEYRRKCSDGKPELEYSHF